MAKKLKTVKFDKLAKPSFTKEVKEEKKPEKKEVKEKKSLVTYLGKGGLSGEYRFKEIAGSIVASSKEEAIKKAEEIAVKHPNLLVK